MSSREERQLLIEMGYGKYLPILEKVKGFEWLSEVR
jgi:hypothetical protein